MRRALALLAFLGAAAPTVLAQSPTTTTIRGRVIAADGGDPIRNVRVGLPAPEASPAFTDADGRFILSLSADERGELSASKAGYVTARTAPSGDVEISLARGGVITGHVLGDRAIPLPLATVVAQRVIRTGGQVSYQPAASAETDDLGDYRLFGLPAGEFIVGLAGFIPQGAAPAALQRDRPLSHFYPDAGTQDAAQKIQVAAGVETPGIDLVFTLPPPGPQWPRDTAGPARPSLGTIRGRIVSAEGVPARLARITLDSADAAYGPYLGNADQDGQYELRNLPAGAYRLSAADLGKASVAFGQTRPSDRGAVITLKAGAVVDHVDLVLPRPSVVGGRVVDERGDPMENANVRIYRIAFFKGRRSLVTPPDTPTRQTDDLGRYRIAGLPPGRYLVGAAAARPVAGRQTAEARTYYPGTPSPDEAQVIEITAGQTALNLDIPVRPERGAVISGKAFTAAGAPLAGQVAITQSRRSGALGTPTVVVRTRLDGGFEFQHMAPGEYVLQAAAPSGSVYTESEFASLFVTLNGDDATGLVMRLSAGSTVEGRVRFDGADPPADPDMALSAVPADPDLTSLLDNLPARADIHDDLTFEIGGLNGPRRIQLTQAPAGWALKQVLVNGGDATDMPIPFGTRDQSLRDVEIVLTNRISTITATATGVAAGAADFRFAAFAVDPARRFTGSRFIAIAVPERDGTGTLRALPPGDYYVAAIDRSVFDEAGAADDVAMLESLVAGAARITLTEGETRSVSVRVTGR